MSACPRPKPEPPVPFVVRDDEQVVHTIPRVPGKRSASDRSPPSKKPAQEAPGEENEVCDAILHICMHTMYFGGQCLPSPGRSAPGSKMSDWMIGLTTSAKKGAGVVRQVAAESTESSASSARENARSARGARVFAELLLLSGIEPRSERYGGKLSLLLPLELHCLDMTALAR